MNYSKTAEVSAISIDGQMVHRRLGGIRMKMKDNEVIETLNDMKGVFGKRGHSQYSLYSIDRAIAAIEKQIPAKLIGKSGRYSGHYLCPTCNKMYWKDEIVPNYCQGCGQMFNLD